MGFGIATQTGISAAIQSIPSFMSNKGLRNGYGATFAENFTDGTNTLDPRITFSRASNATVTDSSGNIVYAPHNLLTFSEQFDNAAWSKARATISANTTISPDGATTADKLVEDTTASNTHFTFRTTTGLSSGTTNTVSIYAKAAERTRIIIGTWDGSTGLTTVYNLITGVVDANSAGVTASMTPIGNGWYRCVHTRNIAAASTTIESAFYLDNGSSGAASANYTGNGTSGLFIWGAQLNVGSLQSYNPTTVKNLLGFSEAFDNAAWTKSNSFIQTNLLTFSEQFDNAGWTKNASTITANATTAPNGTITADTLVENATSNEHNAAQLTSFTSGITYTFSVYVKRESRDFVVLSLGAAAFGSATRAWFNINTGTVGTLVNSPTASITPVGNGWYRCVITKVATATASSNCLITVSNADNVLVYTGDGTSGIFIWGAQLVQGSVAGDYQQTTSSALAVQYQDPNGTMTADKLVENTANAQHVLLQSVTPISGTPYTFSVYVKAGERSRFLIVGGAGFAANQAGFNLSTGATFGVVGCTAFITAIGNGWFRCSWRASATSATSSSFGIYLDNGSTPTYTGDGTSGIYIWGAQLSDSASLDQYVNNPVAAPSSTAFYGARFDYDPVTLQPRGLLIEEQRTNLVLRSEEFENANWIPTGVSVTANSSTSPSGTTTADTLIADGATSSHFLGATDGAGAKAVSVYAKAGTGIFFQIAVGGTAEPYANFNLSTGASSAFGTGTTASITAVGNGWYRCVMVTTNAAATAVRFAIVSSISSARLESFASSATVLLWGAQSELGAFPTSYIPTTTAQVTRSADVTLIQGSNFSSWYNPNEGTMFTEASKPFAIASGARVWQIDDGTSNNRIGNQYDTSTAASIIVTVSSVTQASISLNTTALNRKLATAYNLNDFASSVNGSTVGTDTNGTIPVVNQSRFPSDLNGHIRQIAYYPVRLQNSQLQAITS